MAKLVWMSDLHFTSDSMVLGHDPRLRLQAAIDHINTHHSDARMCVISGDMVNRGELHDYEGLSSMLSRLAIPYVPMVGNHDNRALLRQTLPLPGDCMADFVQFTVEIPGGLVICLDTQQPGSDAGTFCEARQDWLRDALRKVDDRAAYVFMHHPPMPLGLPMQDTENLQDGQAFIELAREFKCLKYLFIGHVHRPISGTVEGIPFSTMRSVLYQAPPPRPSWDWTTFEPGKEAPSIGVVHLEGGTVNLHYEQFCRFEVGVADV